MPKSKRPDSRIVTMYLSGDGVQVYDAIMDLSRRSGMSASNIVFLAFMRGWESVECELDNLVGGSKLPCPPPPKEVSARKRSKAKSA